MLVVGDGCSELREYVGIGTQCIGLRESYEFLYRLGMTDDDQYRRQPPQLSASEHISVLSYQLAVTETYLRRWEVDVGEVQNLVIESSKAAVDFAKLGLRTIALMNGGALIALPTFAQLLSQPNNRLIIWAMVAFVVGIVCAACAIILAYLSAEASTTGHSHRRAARGAAINSEKKTGEEKEQADSETAGMDENASRLFLLQKRFAVAGLILVILGLASFGIGAAIGASAMLG